MKIIAMKKKKRIENRHPPARKIKETQHLKDATFLGTEKKKKERKSERKEKETVDQRRKRKRY